MKKFVTTLVAALAAITCAFAFTACGDEKDEEENVTYAPITQEQWDDFLTFAYNYYYSEEGPVTCDMSKMNFTVKQDYTLYEDVTYSMTSTTKIDYINSKASSYEAEFKFGSESGKTVYYLWEDASGKVLEYGDEVVGEGEEPEIDVLEGNGIATAGIGIFSEFVYAFGISVQELTERYGNPRATLADLTYDEQSCGYKIQIKEYNEETNLDEVVDMEFYFADGNIAKFVSDYYYLHSDSKRTDCEKVTERFTHYGNTSVTVPNNIKNYQG